MTPSNDGQVLSGSVKQPSAAQKRVLRALDHGSEDFSFANFTTLCRRARMKRPELRRVVRCLARLGMAEYGRGLWFEDDTMAGSGYRITKSGRAALKAGA